jgi:peptide/nickel transport system ATP-binding protein
LRTSFITEAGVVPAVDGVSLSVPQGKTVALVGESGCGKSVTALSIMRLIPEPPGKILGGQVLLGDVQSESRAHARVGMPPEAAGESSGMAPTTSSDNPFPHVQRTWATHPSVPHVQKTSGAPAATAIDLLQLKEKEMRKLRGNRVAMIFQEPYVSLNPVQTIGRQIIEAIELHQPLRGRAARTAAIEMLRKVKIPSPERRIDEYPHRMSGGMQQRVMIAMALSCQPSLLIADEPTTALDVTVQLEILALLRELQVRLQMSILLITHDFGVVAEAADYVYVMYAGRIVEHGPVKQVLSHPLHPYTEALLHCTLRLSLGKERLAVIPGSVPDPAHFPSGCRFHPRCLLSAERAKDPARTRTPIDSQIGDAVLARCVEKNDMEPSGVPELRELLPGRHVACWEADGKP